MSTTSPLINLELYTRWTPILMGCLGSLYLGTILYRLIKWKYRQRKVKKSRWNRQKLEKFWRAHSVQLQKPLPTHLTNSFESTATLVVEERKEDEKYSRKRDAWVGKVTHHKQHQRKKQRLLLWQWSVAMGYCRYYHGYQLNTLIHQLVEGER